MNGLVAALVANLESYDPLAPELSEQWLDQDAQHRTSAVGLGALTAECVPPADGAPRRIDGCGDAVRDAICGAKLTNGASAPEDR